MTKSEYQIARPIGASYRCGVRMTADAAHWASMNNANARHHRHAIQGGRKTIAGLISELGPFDCAAAREYVEAVCYAATMPIHDPGPGNQWVRCGCGLPEGCSDCIVHGWKRVAVQVSQ